MVLHDEIRNDVRVGIVPRRFRVVDPMMRPDPEQRDQYLVGDLSDNKRSRVVMPANRSG